MQARDLSNEESCNGLSEALQKTYKTSTSLSFDGRPSEGQEEEAQEDQVAPPDDRVAQKVNPLVVA